MNDPEPNPSPNDLDAYLDGLLGPHEREEFARRLATDATLRLEMELQRQIDGKLQAQFQPPAVPTLDLTKSFSEPAEMASRNGTRQPLPTSDGLAHRPARLAAPAPRRSLLNLHIPRASRWQIACLTVVAAVAWLAVLWNVLPIGKNRIVFKERPLAEVYDETVAFGFEPYYVCDEEERFRTTFYHRHGQALKLDELPPGREMVGLSYLPSISRHTTAMLARVDGREVMVFVDKRARDRSLEPPPAASGLRMFRREVNDLVMYEVTPLERPLVMSFLLPADPPPDACLTD